MSDVGNYWLQLPDGSRFGPGSMDTLVQWARQGRVPHDATVVSGDGAAPRAIADVPQLAAILQAPPIVPGRMPAPEAPMSGLIPYRNPAALVGYYLAVFSLIPMVGLVLGPAAVVCGIFGLRAGMRRPEARGKAHAVVAIVLGGLTSVFYWAVAILIFVGRRA